LFLADGNVNAIERAAILVAGLLRRKVERALLMMVSTPMVVLPSNGRDDQFTLAAADGNHRVNAMMPVCTGG